MHPNPLGLLLAACLLAGAAAAPTATIAKAATRPSAAALRAFLTARDFEDGEDVRRFAKDGTYSGAIGSAVEIQGEWRLRGGDVVVTAKGCSITDEACNWKADFAWTDALLAGDQYLIVTKDGAGLSYYCDPQKSDCQRIELVTLQPGSSDKALYAAIRERLAAQGLAGYHLIEGPAPKHARAVSEVWYLEGHRDAADKLAAVLSDIIGPVTPKEWTWGGPYRVLVIAGDQKAARSR